MKNSKLSKSSFNQEVLPSFTLLRGVDEKIPTGGWRGVDEKIPTGGWRGVDEKIPTGGWRGVDEKIPTGGWRGVDEKIPTGGWRWFHFKMPLNFLNRKKWKGAKVVTAKKTKRTKLTNPRNRN